MDRASHSRSIDGAGLLESPNPLRILFFMAHPGHMRNFDSTLRALAARGHFVHVAFDRLKKNLPHQMHLIEDIARTNRRVTFGNAPATSPKDWSLFCRQVRTSIDYLHWLDPQYDEAEKLRSRIAERTPAPVRALASVPGVNSPRGRRAFDTALRTVDDAAPKIESVRQFIGERDPDVVLVTPLLELGSPQLDYIRIAMDMRISTGLCVASWDNLTTVGIIQEVPDVVMVWNDAQKGEAVEAHGVPADRVAVTGAATYDHWFDWTPSTDRDEFCALAGLDPSKPYLLYLGSSEFIAQYEAPFILRWLKALRASEDPKLRDVGVLIRPHPTNPIRGKNDERRQLLEHENVVIWPPAGANPTDASSRAAYFDSMHHSAAVVGVNTSALIESAIVGRAVLTVLTDEFKETQQGTVHFHHLLGAHGGLLNVARTIEEHHLQLAETIASPQGMAEHNQRFLEGFIRPYGLGEPATPRMVEAIEEVARRPSRTRTRRRASLAIQPFVAPVARSTVRFRDLKKGRDTGTAPSPREILGRGVAAAGGAAGAIAPPGRKDGPSVKARARRVMRRSLDVPAVRRVASRAAPYVSVALADLERAERGEKKTLAGRTSKAAKQASAKEQAAKAKAAAKAKEAKAREAKAREAKAREAKAKAAKAKAAKAKARTEPPLFETSAAPLAALARVDKGLAAIAAEGRPVVVGPWLGGFASETLLWIPFLRWVRAESAVRAAPLIVVSRGGMEGWYRDLDCDYVDIHDVATLPPGFLEERQARNGSGVQDAPTELEERLFETVKDRMGLENAGLLHSATFITAREMLAGAGGAAATARILVDRPLESSDLPPLPFELPERYVAADLSFDRYFPNTSDNLNFLRRLLERITRTQAVVVLAVDDAVELMLDDLDSDAVMRLPQSPAREEMQTLTAVLGRAEASIGTVGGLVTVSPLLGVPALYLHSFGAARSQPEVARASRLSTVEGFGPFLALTTEDPELGEFLDRTFGSQEAEPVPDDTELEPQPEVRT